MFELRPGTEADVIALYGEPPKHTSRIVACDIDGKVAGIGALVKMEGGQWFIVSAITPGLEDKRFSLHRGALQIMRWVKEMGLKQVFTLEDPNLETSPVWISRLGFEPYSVQDGWKVWKWHKQQ